MCVYDAGNSRSERPSSSCLIFRKCGDCRRDDVLQSMVTRGAGDRNIFVTWILYEHIRSIIIDRYLTTS